MTSALNSSYKIICTIILLLTSLELLHGGLNVWTSNGPYGGHIVSLAVNPLNHSVIYAGCDDSGGIFKTTDGGETWVFVTSSVPDVCGWAVAIDPQNSGIIYAADIYGLGVYKSTNNGATWEFKNTGLGETHVTCFAFNGDSSNIIYAGTGGWRFPGNGVYKSVNAGTSWVSSGLSGMKVYCLATRPDAYNILYAGTHGNGFYRSTDAGNSWSPLPLPSPYVNCLAIDPASTNIIYAGTLAGIYRTTNGGSTWDSLGLFQELIWSMAIDPASPNVIYASTCWNGSYKSTDSGLTWSPINAGINYPINFCIAVDPVSPSTLYLGTAAGGVYKSLNGGAYWSQRVQGMKNTYAFGLVPHPDTANVIYAGRCYAEPGAFFYRSIDGGQNWTSLTQFVNVGLTALMIDPDDHRAFYAGAIKAVVKTTDHGATWILLDSLLFTEERVPSMAIDPFSTNIVYAGAYIVDPDTGISIRKSVDHGVHWSEIAFFPKTVESNALDPVSDILHGGALAVSPTSSNVIYAGAFGGVFKSTDAGNIWSIQGLANEAIFCLKVKPDSEQTIYAGCESGRVFKSTDSGNNWTRIDPAWPSAMITDILVDPSLTNDVYVGRDASDWHTGVHGGVARSTDGGLNWTEIDSGLTTTQAIRLAIDTTANTLYAATYGGGVFSYTFPTGVEEGPSAYEGTQSLGSVHIYPNPFSTSTMISFGLTPGLKSIELRIYDAAGRLVKSFELPAVHSILSTNVIWDGSDNFGGQAPAGVYFGELKSQNWKTVTKLILLRKP